MWKRPIGVALEIDVLMLQRAPQPLDEDVVHPAAAAVHGDLDPGRRQRAGKRRRGEMRALDALLFVKRQFAWLDFLATLRDEREDLSRKVAFQGSNGVEFGMPFCYPTGNVILGSLVGP
jgi:hypothetical protein